MRYILFLIVFMLAGCLPEAEYQSHVFDQTYCDWDCQQRANEFREWYVKNPELFKRIVLNVKYEREKRCGN